jgi:single-stranded-DNA-specific exonuclease
LRDNEFIVNVGGHKQALGITVAEDKFNDFYTSLQEATKEIPEDILNPKKLPLGFIPINKIDIEFFKAVSELEPFGQGFKKPTFVTRAVLKTARLVGKQKNHLTVTITDKKGLIKFSGMQFFTTELPETGKEYMIYFHLDEDNFRGTGKVQLKITDINDTIKE